jgi:hypothetical protein
MSSCVLFAWLVLVGPPGNGFKLAEAATYLGASALLGLVRRRQRLREGPAGPAEPAGWFGPLLSAALGLAVAAKLTSFVLNSFCYPHGLGDAWFTWNMRARFLYRGGEHWIDALSNLIGEGVGDYPLLLPLSIARGWHYLGGESPVVPATVALLFTFGTVGTLYAGLTVLRGRSQGALAGLLLLGTFMFVPMGYVQMADIPLGYFFLAALTLLAVQDALAPGKGRLLLAAGLMTSFAAWTKNEGLLFAGAVVLARLLVAPRLAGPDAGPRPGFWRDRARQLTLLLLGALPVVCVLGYFKACLAPPSYFVEGQGWPVYLARLGSYERYRLVGGIFLLRLVQLGGPDYQFVPGSGVVFLLPVYRVLLGRVPPGVRMVPSATVWVVVILMLLGYGFVYLVTPLDLLGHLNSSLSRLLLHLWPLVLFGFFLRVATPEEALARQAAPVSALSLPAEGRAL